MEIEENDARFNGNFAGRALFDLLHETILAFDYHLGNNPWSRFQSVINRIKSLCGESLVQGKRGLATGILAASTATGQLLLLPILAMIIENYSWRWAIGFIIAILMVMTLIIFFFMKNSPKEMGILPYGQLEEMEETKNTQHGNPVVVAFGGLAEAVKKKNFGCWPEVSLFAAVQQWG